MFDKVKSNYLSQERINTLTNIIKESINTKDSFEEVSAHIFRSIEAHDDIVVNNAKTCHSRLSFEDEILSVVTCFRGCEISPCPRGYLVLRFGEIMVQVLFYDTILPEVTFIFITIYT